MKMRWIVRLLALCGTLLALSGCGGGGGGGGSSTPAPTAPPATGPVVTPSFGIKQLKFSWPAVSDATYYQLEENPHGSSPSGYAQVGSDITGTSVTQDVAIAEVDWLNATYYVNACNSLGCTPSSIITVVGDDLQTIGYVKAPAPNLHDYFGGAAVLSQDGNTLVVGAYDAGNTSTVDNGQGAVYIFVRSSTGVWSRQATLTSPNPDSGDRFGFSLALSNDGNTLAVGAPNEDGSGHGINPAYDNNASNTGAVYLYTRSSTTWSAPIYMKASDTAGSFGYALAMNDTGTRLYVGAPTTANGGQVYALGSNTSGIWSQAYILTGSNTAAGDGFGSSLSFGNNTAITSTAMVLAVGAPYEDSSTTGVNPATYDDLATNSGAVYIYKFDASGIWIQNTYLKAPNTGAGDFFGYSVSLVYDTTHSDYSLLVGAPTEDSAATGVCPIAAAACITAQADNSATSAGAVYSYLSNYGTLWTAQDYIKGTNTGAGDDFGYSLAQSYDATTLAIGAASESGSSPGVNGADNNLAKVSGAAYLFTQSATQAWSQTAYIKASNPEAYDEFAASLSLSGDGSTLAVGAMGESSGISVICAAGDTACATAQADNTQTSAGAVYLY